MTYKGELLSGDGTLFIYNDGTSVCRLGGDLYGNVLTPVLVEAQSELSGIMLGNYNGEFIDNLPIVLDLAWFRKRPIVRNSKIIPGDFILRTPAARDLYSISSDINAYRSELKFNETTINKIEILTTATQVRTSVTLASPYILLPDGSFSFQITTPSTITISGKFNKKTSFIENIVSDDPLYDILTLSIVPVWDMLPYGSSQFDSVSFDIGGFSNTSIPSTATHDAFVDKVNQLDTGYVSIYSTLPYQIINNQIKFTLPISPSLTPLDPFQINKQFEVYMIHNGVYMGSAHQVSYMLDLNSSVPTELVFVATEDFRLRVLDNITKYSPLYFGIINAPL